MGSSLSALANDSFILLGEGLLLKGFIMEFTSCCCCLELLFSVFRIPDSVFVVFSDLAVFLRLSLSSLAIGCATVNGLFVVASFLR